MSTNQSQQTEQPDFKQKVWIAGSIVALIFVLIWLFKVTFNVFLLVLAGGLIAIFFHGLAGLVAKYTKIKGGWSVLVSVLITFALIIATGWLIGAKVQSQVARLADTLPATIENAKEQLNDNALGRKIVENISSPAAQQKAKSVASTFFQSTFGVLGDIYVVLFIGLFFTVSPEIYKKGLVSMIPPRHRPKARDILDQVSAQLRKWLKGKLFAMLVVFILTSIALAILGLPMWLALALIAGILNFIPNFGPLIAMIPAVLVALLQGPVTAAIVAGIYILVQVIESNFITPMVQQRLVQIPPALIIIAQLLMGALTGGWGLILATPIIVILMLLVNKLYIQPMEQGR